MKNRLVLFLMVILMAACNETKYEPIAIPEPVADELKAIQADENTESLNDKCLLNRIVWSDGSSYSFQYNSQGKAKSWLVDYGDDVFNNHELTYDNLGRLRTSHMYFPGGYIDYTFYYNNANQVNRAKGYAQDGSLYEDIVYRYNQKGEMISQDITPQDFHTKFFYDQPGNLVTVKYYIATELFLQINYEYSIPNRNPYLGLTGINFGFPFYTLPLFDKRWESRASAIYYEEGVPYLISDQDPAQTQMQTGQRNYMTHVTFYDRVPGTAGMAHVTYLDCGNNVTGRAESLLSSGELNVITRLNKILNTRSPNIRQELKELKEEVY